MAIYYHGLPLGAAKLAVEAGELLSPEEQHKKDMGWDSLTSEQRQRKIEQMSGVLSTLVGKPVRTEDDLFRALSHFPDHEYESRFQNLTFTKSLDEAFGYSARHGTPGVILGLEFPDNGRRWIKTPRKPLDDLRQVVMNPAAVELQEQVKQLFGRYRVEFYKLVYS